MVLQRKWKIAALLMAFVLLLAMAAAGCADNESQGPNEAKEPANKKVILATTTSTVDTGLLDELLPIFKEQTGYEVSTIAVGTGEALRMGEEGNADVLLTHAPASEQPLVDKGDVINYQLVMHNDFVIVGPASDPAKIKGMKSAADSFKKIMDSSSAFVSRGDDSGTHKKEKSIWEKLNVEPKGDWYIEAGAGMGDTLRMASEEQAYTLTDRGTYLAWKDKLDLEVMVEGDKILLNIYHVMQVNPEKNDKINAEGAKAFVEFMVSPDTQKIIEDFGKDKYGEPLFIPDAGKNEDEIGM
ncbi:MAG: solute-binding protein [Syntrophomonadaceae bacterium]|jgi:tungstate transport system substrate-binding protein|nr:substrate-binding domain-containing protein [Thermoanaerobacterales bacterium]NLN21006.1 solute-binding protein [Syntrophomonadaceae bacterium]HAF17894.1 tungsten ABC transporter substrate-binding protein [Peptococcaceae bacterium]